MVGFRASVVRLAFVAAALVISVCAVYGKWATNPRTGGRPSQEMAGDHPKDLAGDQPEDWNVLALYATGDHPENWRATIPRLAGDHPKNWRATNPRIGGASAVTFGWLSRVRN